MGEGSSPAVRLGEKKREALSFSFRSLCHTGKYSVDELKYHDVIILKILT